MNLSLPKSSHSKGSAIGQSPRDARRRKPTLQQDKNREAKDTRLPVFMYCSEGQNETRSPN
jgi:hypothetical protein